MIRLTELETTEQVVTVKIEGYLTEATLQVLEEALSSYQQRSLTEVRLMADGLLSVDRRALERGKKRFPQGLKVVFHTSRIALQYLLESCGLEVVLTPSA
jgi:hypothetical protein